MKSISCNTLTEKDCCGCGACSVVCPKKCIDMKASTLGHLFSVVDTEKCVDCGKCARICPMLGNIQSIEPFQQSVYASYANDPENRLQGSSGGIFGVLSKMLLDEGYTVYGAAFDDDLKLKCTPANDVDGLQKLFKSKYLQSDLTDRFIEIRQLLNEGKKVLFVSTPCQVKALRLFLEKDHANLLTVDFFCHGVPSQLFFDQCIDYESKLRGGKIINYQFRTKVKNGTTTHYFTEVIRKDGYDKSITGFYFQSPFYAFFQRYINLRESCYQCPFAGTERSSDITIGDFHDIDNYISGINRFDGVSTVVVNTPKGNALWEKAAPHTTVFPLELTKLIANGVCFSGGTKRPKDRDEFLSDYRKMEMKSLVNKWVGSKKYTKQRIYYKMPRFMRIIFKKVIGL